MQDNIVPSILEEYIDDYYGLWEFDWGLNSRRFSNDKSQRILLLKNLVIEEYMLIFYGRLGRKDSSPVPIKQALSLIERIENWSPRKNIEDDVVFLTTSEKGEEFVNEAFSN